MRKNKQPNTRQIKDKNNKILTKEQEIMNRWQEYFKELLNTDNGNNESFEDEITASVNLEENNEIGINDVTESIDSSTSFIHKLKREN